MYVEKKLEINAKKVAFAKSFPGRLDHWQAAVGKTVAHIISPDQKKYGVVVFSDDSFIFIPSPDLQPAQLIQCILAAKPVLGTCYTQAYGTLEALIAEDQEMQRLARLENIMGAIRNNFPQIPELKKELQVFLKKL